MGLTITHHRENPTLDANSEIGLMETKHCRYMGAIMTAPNTYSCQMTESYINFTGVDDIVKIWNFFHMGKLDTIRKCQATFRW